MLTEPIIVTRPSQPFAAIVLTVRQPEIAATAPPLIGEVIAWITAHGGQLAGVPFFNYVSFLPDGNMQMQVGMPTTSLLAGDDRVTTGTLSGGRYASLTHTGPYHELYDANMRLDSWAKSSGHRLDGRLDGDRFVDATRLEIYHKDPGEDPSGHPVTEVAFRVQE